MAEEDDTLEDEYSEEVIDEPPGSPGLEIMMREKNEAHKRLPDNVKFNQSFNVAKQCADYLKNAPSATFENYLECFKSFSKYLRDGMPEIVMDFLNNPSEFELLRKNEPEENNSTATNEREEIF